MGIGQRKKMQLLEKYRAAVEGVSIYQTFEDGSFYCVRGGEIEEVSRDNHEMHSFITNGNLAIYWEGNPNTSRSMPNNATVKSGMTQPKGNFEPHSHGTRHRVITHNYGGGCLLANSDGDIFDINLAPNAMIDILGGIPHAFYNRASIPLRTTIINGGLGINQEEYATKLEDAKNKGNIELANTLEKMTERFSRVVLDLSEEEKKGLELRIMAQELGF